MSEPIDQANPSPAAMRAIEELRQGPIDVPMVQVVGDFTDQVRFVSSTAMSALLSFAKLVDNDGTVLLPFVDLKIQQEVPSDDGELAEETLLSMVLPMENAAFLAVNLVSDLRSVCEDLASLKGSGTALERKRLEQTRYYLAHTVREAVVATSMLTVLLDEEPLEE